ncbi:MAG: ABC transporter permease subunit [Bifidobacteriaceae bacterium]|jgi:ABC-2 type transport system permease protein|nr:ABC transporter permease subunit [Bifidobacteriaceae bacterium]
MLNAALLKQTVRENAVLWTVLTGVQCLMVFSVAMNAPIAAAGVAYYNLLPGIFAGIYAITVGNRLICAKVDRGTLAYVLATPVRRRAVTTTQAAFFGGSLLAMCALGAAAHCAGAALSSFGLTGADVRTVLELNLGLFLLGWAFAGICFAASCVFNLTKHTIATGGGLVCAFLLLPIMAMFGQNYAFMRHLTIVSLYDVPAIMAHSAGWFWGLVALGMIGAAAGAAGSWAFTRRDLPL